MPARKRMRLTDAAIARCCGPARGNIPSGTRARPASGSGSGPPAGGAMSCCGTPETDRGASRSARSPRWASPRRAGNVTRERRSRTARPDRRGPPPCSATSSRGEWKEARFDRCKPATGKSYASLLDGRLLPAFGAQPLDRISPAHVRRWFDDFSRTAPGNANHGLGLLRGIMDFAVARGLVETNPARGVKPNRREALTRFLSREEIARLHGALDRQTGRGKRFRQQADIVRLLLLTGCRRSEIVRLRWSEVDEAKLVLADSKTGPRTVPLNVQARRILDRQPRNGSPFVFPSPRDPARPRGGNLSLWYRIRREAGIEDVRLHDLRHTHATHAVMNGVPVPVVSRLLGHSNTRMTLRYAHLGDHDIEQAAERVGEAVADLMGLP